MTRAAPVPTPTTAPPPPLMSFLAASLLHLHLFISIRLFSGSASADFWMLLALLCRLLSWNCLVCHKRTRKTWSNGSVHRDRGRARNNWGRRNCGKREKKKVKQNNNWTYPRSVTVLDRRRRRQVDWLCVARWYDQRGRSGGRIWRRRRVGCLAAAAAARHAERVTDALQLVRLRNKWCTLTISLTRFFSKQLTRPRVRGHDAFRGQTLAHIVGLQQQVGDYRRSV